MSGKNNNKINENNESFEGFESQIDSKIEHFENISNKSASEKLDEIKSLMEFIKTLDKMDFNNETNDKITKLKELIGDNYKENTQILKEIQKAEITSKCISERQKLNAEIEKERFQIDEKDLTTDDFSINISQNTLNRIKNPQSLSDNALIIGVCTLETLKVALTLSKDILIGIKNSIKDLKSIYSKTSTYENQI